MSPARKSRRGFSLVEVVLVIGAISLLLGLCSGLIHVLLRLDRAGRAHLVETTTVGRLARQFRRDVDAAARVKLVPADDREDAELELTLADGRVVAYRGGEHDLVRLERRDGGGGRRESYALPSTMRPRFAVGDAESQTWVTLRLPRGAGDGPASLHQDLRIEALMGRDHRRSQPERKEASP